MSADAIRTIIILGIGVCVIAGLLFFAQTPPPAQTTTVADCTTIGEQTPVAGSQGHRIWSGPSLKAFEPPATRACVPDGWELLGPGLMIHSDDFTSLKLEFENSSYTVRMIYPVSASSAQAEAYSAIVTNAFNSIGRLYFDNLKDKYPFSHTVLVTAGIAGDTKSDETRVYPDPGPDVTMLVRTPDQTRAEELFIHAIAHLYNRERYDFSAYESHQAPLAAGDWQEMEAAWAELAYEKSTKGRLERLRYLYSVHTAVQTNNFSLITLPPFNDKEEFAKMRKTLSVSPTASHLDEQYGHYILAPLVMTAIEGLLIRNKTNTHVEALLVDLHIGKTTNFFDELAKLIPATDVSHILKWIAGTEKVPEDLVYIGAQYYSQKSF